MITSLRIHQLALIQDLQLDFHEGMHTLTRETGAGKSIVVDAVNLGLGGRADRELIRTSTDKAWVELVFEAPEGAPVHALLQANGMDVVYSRTGNSTVPLQRRTVMANEAGADLFVSIHVNANPSAEVQGFETYYLDIARNPEAWRLCH